MNNVLIVNKNKNVTSRDVVNDLVHFFNTKKIGHTGTLDPIATGVLVCTIGKCTKLNLDLTSEYKEYIAEFKLGVNTDSLDITGKVLNEGKFDYTLDEVKNAILSFKGVYNQEVPIYSSVKINGKKLYEYARNNESVELPSREVDIKNIEFISCNDGIYKFKCLVSKGTYIRSLIRDIGIKLGTYGCMVSLIRTKQGKFDIENSYTIDEIRDNKFKLLNIEDVLDVLVVDCDEEMYKSVFNGVKKVLDTDKEYVLFKYNKEDICLYKKIDDYFRMYLSLK